MSIQHDNYDDLIKAEYLGGYKIKCTFKNGKQGIVEMDQYCKKGGVFSRFNDIEYFKNFHIDNGVLAWGDSEIDIAPETLYHNATGEPYPEWMEAS
jgi:hypothetical protein